MFGKPCGCVRKSKQDTDRGTEGPQRTLLSKGRVAAARGRSLFSLTVLMWTRQICCVSMLWRSDASTPGEFGPEIKSVFLYWERGRKKHYDHHAYIFLQDSSLGFFRMQDKKCILYIYVYVCLHFYQNISFFFFIICTEYDIMNARFKYCPLREGIHVEWSLILHADTLDNFSLICCPDYGTFLLFKQLINNLICIVICLVFSKILRINWDV